MSGQHIVCAHKKEAEPAQALMRVSAIRIIMNVFSIIAVLLPLLSTACAGIVYLCDCHGTQNGAVYPFAGRIA